MHSHDRTMLARLGFQDPDKKNQEHDDACLYVLQDAVLVKMLAALTPFLNKRIRSHGMSYEVDAAEEAKIGGKQMEYHLSKGEGQYATTIGFFDVFFGARLPLVAPNGTKSIYDAQFFIEVKITPVGAGDILRQMNLYQSYAKHSYGIIITAWEPDEVEDEVFANAGFPNFHLGDGFGWWQAERRNKKAGHAGL